MEKTSKYPFLFYGHDPDDWNEGLQMWLVRFEENPTWGKLRKIGSRTADTLWGTGVVVEDIWFSNENWAVFFAESPEYADHVFIKMAKLFKEISNITPLAKVILASARDYGCSEWDHWTIKQQKFPSVIEGIVVPEGDAFVRTDPWRFDDSNEEYASKCAAKALTPVFQLPEFNEAYNYKYQQLFSKKLVNDLKIAVKSGSPF
ncbi:MAG: hypothetical protein GY754_03605 [bacterium]|nr:hypothetical protein [bacterium]